MAAVALGLGRALGLVLLVGGGVWPRLGDGADGGALRLGGVWAGLDLARGLVLGVDLGLGVRAFRGVWDLLGVGLVLGVDYGLRLGLVAVGLLLLRFDVCLGVWVGLGGVFGLV